MSTLSDNLLRLEENIGEAALRVGRDRREIVLVAVTKGVNVARMQEAIDLGIRHIGENRVQEARSKWPRIASDVEWHMVGHLQSNKAGVALEMFSLLHSLDRPSLLRRLAHRAEKAGICARVLVQVNTSGEATKSGVDLCRAEDFILEALETPGIAVEGLMTIGPLQGGPAAARPGFGQLRRLAERIREMRLPHGQLPYLSMGMTGDYVEAILEGSNMLRVGTAIFGPRR